MQKTLWALPLALAASVMAPLSTLPAQADTPTPSVACQTGNGDPMTVVQNPNSGLTPLIVWQDRYLADQGWTPERRCAEVSQRLNDLYANLKDRFLIHHGTMNGQPVLCAVQSNFGEYTCRRDGLILTLKPQDNPEQVFQQLLSASAQASGGRPLVRSDDANLPISFSNWINAATRAE